MLEADKDLLAEIITEYEAAPFGEKQAVLARRLPLLGISAATFCRWKNNWGRRDYGRKGRADKGQRQQPERAGWVKEVMRLKHSQIKGVRSLATADAVSLAVQWGRVPREALGVPEGTYNRLARELGLTEAPRRGRRFEAPYFNYMHQVDASGSEYLYPDRLENGEWILKFRPRPMKNKPSREGRRRLWYWGLADDFSGARIIRTVVAPGESALDGIEFLKFAWSNDKAHAPLHGIPEILYMDNGVLARHHAMQRFANDNLVTIRTHEPDRAQATGKVETGWKDLWQRFEAPFLRLPDWRTREISLTELNQRLAAFVREANGRRHRHLPMSKTSAWLASARERGGLVDIDPGAWDKVFRDWQRVVDDFGCFELHGAVYQVKEIHSCRVVVYRQFAKGVESGTLLVEDRRDGKRYYANPFELPVAGEFRNTAETPLEKLLKDDPWAGQRPALPEFGADSKVTALPVRPATVRESAFEMPKGLREPLTIAQSPAELAAGVELSHRGREAAKAPELYATPLERYTALKVRGAQGELTAEEREFMVWFEAEYAAMLAIVGGDIARQVRLAAVE